MRLQLQDLRIHPRWRVKKIWWQPFDNHLVSGVEGGEKGRDFCWRICRYVEIKQKKKRDMGFGYWIAKSVRPSKKTHQKDIAGCIYCLLNLLNSISLQDCREPWIPWFPLPQPKKRHPKHSTNLPAGTQCRAHCWDHPKLHGAWSAQLIGNWLCYRSSSRASTWSRHQLDDLGNNHGPPNLPCSTINQGRSFDACIACFFLEQLALPTRMEKKLYK